MGDGPYLLGAQICESWHQDRENNSVDLIGIHGIALAERSDEEERHPNSVDVLLVVSLARGDKAGESKVSIRSRSAGVNVILTAAFTEEEPADKPYYAPVKLRIPTGESGVHWLDISIDGNFVTRVPLRVVRGLPGLKVESLPPL